MNLIVLFLNIFSRLIFMPKNYFFTATVIYRGNILNRLPSVSTGLDFENIGARSKLHFRVLRRLRLGASSLPLCEYHLYR